MNQDEAWEAAWRQCYDYFGCSETEYDREIAGLRLAFYLASFGMFRASGKTRALQLMQFSKIACVCRRYGSLRDLEPEELATRQGEVEEFLDCLKECLKEMSVSATDTLITKIALGATACVPAYDRFAVTALGKHEIVGSPSHQGLKELYSLRKKDLVLFKMSYDSTVPFMRCLDVGLMKYGKQL